MYVLHLYFKIFLLSSSFIGSLSLFFNHIQDNSRQKSSSVKEKDFTRSINQPANPADAFKRISARFRGLCTNGNDGVPKGGECE